MIHFLHIGKTGGNAIKAALRPIMQDYDLVLHEHDTRLCDVPMNDPVFCSLRDPISRFVSAFNSRLRQGRPKYNSLWTPAERRAFGFFPTPNALAEALTSADAGDRKEAEAAMHGIGHVRHPLSYWLHDRASARERPHLTVLFQDRLARDFEGLKRRYGLPPSVSLPTDPVEAHVTPEGMERHLSSLGLRNLSSWYAEDIALYDAMRRDHGRGDVV